MAKLGTTMSIRLALRAIIYIALAALCLTSCRPHMAKGESITVGIMPLEAYSLLYIAEDMHFFAENALTVTFRSFETGVATTDALMRGEVDIAGSSEFPFVVKSFGKEKLHIFTSFDKYQSFFLIGRNDHGIRNGADLKGKRIGVTRQTIAEFYLGRFLELRGMRLKDIDIVDRGPPALVDALTNGDIDAVLVWQPYAQTSKERLGDRVVTWPAQSSQVTLMVLTCRDEWLAGHPEAVSRFLKSLDAAEDYLIAHTPEAQAAIKKRLHYDDGYIRSVWPEHQFSLSLDQSLILAMEDEARWMIKNGLTGEKKMPDFTDYVYTKGLEAVKPESVNIIQRGAME